MVKDIKSYILNKLFFPRIVINDEPGIMISKTISRYSKKVTKKRLIYDFEDIIVGLQNATKERIGFERTNKLWYEIGKDVGTGHILLSGKKEVPNFILAQVVEFVFNVLCSSGMSAAKKIEFNRKENKIELAGEENLFCRKTKINGFHAGVVCGILSALVGKNTEAETLCSKCPAGCRIVAEENVKKKYIPRFDDLTVPKNYHQLNFRFESKFQEKVFSFNDMIRFKKINFDKRGFIFYKDERIYPAYIGMSGIIAKKYVENNLQQVLESGIKQGAIDTASKIIDSNLSKENKIKLVKDLFISFGYGRVMIIKTNRSVKVRLIQPPFNQYGYLFQALVFNGFLTSALCRDVYLRDLRSSQKPILAVQMDYTFTKGRPGKDTSIST
ncbi:hypothetical protein JXA85_03950 [Candidatus Woesearchaeota archaeon]|nr:hypothetical protein [Candidatus Woesearchaeota archaeon]